MKYYSFSRYMYIFRIYIISTYLLCIDAYTHHISRIYICTYSRSLPLGSWSSEAFNRPSIHPSLRPTPSSIEYRCIYMYYIDYTYIYIYYILYAHVYYIYRSRSIYLTYMWYICIYSICILYTYTDAYIYIYICYISLYIL